jgi:hypothetical protein
MMKYPYLWHWSPRCRRHSIETDGLRRLSWNGGRLILYTVRLSQAGTMRAHIARRHGVIDTTLDGWLVRKDAKDCTLTPLGIVLVLTDITRAQWAGPFPEPPSLAMCREIMNDQHEIYE